MKNITVSIDDDTYRRVRIKAAEQNTSLSALVKRFLKSWRGRKATSSASSATSASCARALPPCAGDRLSPEDVHGRGA